MRVSKLEAFLRFLNEAQTEIRYVSMPVEQLLSLHPENLKILSFCVDRLKQNSDFPKAWKSAIKKEAKAEGFFQKDLLLLLDFGEGFGCTDTQGQLSHCSLYTAFFQANLKEAKEDFVKKSRLYVTLGVFGGLAVSLLLC